MFQLLIDTCVWLDIAKDPDQHTLLAALETLVEEKKVELIVPRTVLDEFARNKARIVEDSTRSISSTLKRAREIVSKFSDGRRQRIAIQQIQDINHRIPALGDAAIESVAKIGALFKGATIVEITDAHKLRAAQRAIDKHAPFHRQRNGMGDALLIEVYTELVAKLPAKGRRHAFVTHNTADFSDPHGDKRLPHPDLASLFSKVKSLYSISLVESLKRIEPGLLRELTFESEWSEEPRSATELIAAIGEPTDKVWYNRHHNTRYEIAKGTTKVVPDAQWKPSGGRTIKNEIWEGALRAAAAMERKYGMESLGPWSDFEWGMLNGKLSALRWALGEEWDMLDT
jgi:hypothetical protein